MADADELREVALSLEGVEENESDGFDFRVGGRGFVWSYPERVPGRRRVIRTDIAVLFVGDEAEKQALLLGEPELFFTVPSYDGVPLVMVRSTGSARSGSRSSSPTPGECAAVRSDRSSRAPSGGFGAIGRRDLHCGLRETLLADRALSAQLRAGVLTFTDVTP